MPKAKVLIVDDDPFLVAQLQLHLENSGYEIVATAPSGREALEQAGRHRPDVALMDIMLTGDMDGVETTRRIHEQANIPVIYLTAHSDVRFWDRARETDPFGYLLKPLQKNELQFALDTALIRYRVEEAIRAKRDFLNSILDNSMDSILTINDEGILTFINKQLLLNSGYQRSQIVGCHFLEFIPRDLYPDMLGHWEKLLQGMTGIFETRLLKADGSSLECRISYSPIRDGGQNFLAIIKDLSEVREVEEKFRATAKRFETLFRQSKDALFISTRDGKILDMNAAGLELFGYTRRDLDRISARDLYVNAVDRQPFLDQMNGKGYVKDLHLQLKRKDESILHCLETSVATRDDQGNIVEYQGIIRDITRQVTIQKSLEKAVAEARQANAVKDRFLANLSHEIRTPLNVVLGYSEVLEHTLSATAPVETSEFFKAIKSNGDRLLRTVSEMIDLSQIEAGLFPLKKTRVCLGEILETVIREYRPRAREKNLTIAFERPQSNLTVKADQYCLLEATRNLIDNAIKYSDHGRITITLKVQVKRLVLTISDCGIGISDKYIKRLFEPFSQESEGYTKKYQGIGLGLALTKRYLDMNQIRIDVKSKKGQGSSFVLTFDRSK